MSGNVVNMGIVHRYIHDGVDFFATLFATITGSGTSEILFETPADHEIHFTSRIVTAGSGFVELFEDTTKTRNVSNPIPARNRKRYATRVSSVTVSHTPDGSGDGTTLWKITMGTAASGPVKEVGGGNEDRNEVILKKSAKYLLRITGDDMDVTWLLDWYEILED